MADIRKFRVISGPLGIRDAANGNRLQQTIATDVVINVGAASRQETGGYVWWQHDQGWSAERDSSGNNIFMIDVTDAAEDQPRTFEVVVAELSIRSSPNGPKLTPKLVKGQRFTTTSATPTETAGFLWWPHSQGWSAQRDIAGKSVYVRELSAAAATGSSAATPPGTPTPTPTPPPAPVITAPPQIVMLRAATDVRVRTHPSLAPGVSVITTLKRGADLDCDMNTIITADGYVWLKHSLGWSAWKSEDGATVFLLDKSQVPAPAVIGPDGPQAETLPGYKTLIKRMPVDLVDTQWWQYFGNNTFAYVHGKSYNYDGYSQGLHGGLDFGNSLRAGVKIYAGVEGTFVKTETTRARNWRVWIKSGDYMLIYQHIINPTNFAPGQAVTPDTVVAEIEHSSQGGGWDHLHFEIRYDRETWIVNPLLLMPDAMVKGITDKFNPLRPKGTAFATAPSDLYYFFMNGGYTRWTSPLDQPMIKRGGPVIGPRG